MLLDSPIVTGSIVVSGSTIFGSSLNTQHQFTGSVSVTGSLSLNGSNVVLSNQTSSISVLSASYASNSDLLDGRDSLTFANTGSNSFVGTQNINGAVAITGSLTTTGVITAQTINVQQVTSSIVFSSGSNIFGNSISNTQSMTGSVGISGSLSVVGAGSFSSTATATAFIPTNSSIPTNGMYLSAANTLAFATNSTNRLSISSAGVSTFSGALSGTSARFSGDVDLAYNKAIRGRNIGNIIDITLIGVFDGLDKVYIDPSAYGTVLGGTLSGTSATFSSTSSATAFIPTNSSIPTNGMYLSGTNTLAFATNTTNRLTITSGGNVGIGTASPAYKLDIYSSSPATIGLKTDSLYNSIIRDYTTTTTSTLDIITERTDGGGFNFLLLVSSTLVASGSNRNYYTFAVQGRGTTATASQLSNVSGGTSARTAIAVSFPSNGVIRLTLTGGEECQIKVTTIGHGSL